MRRLIQLPVVVFVLSLAACAVCAQTGREDYSAEFAKVTPSPLPQSPVVSRPGSDLTDEGLRGRVKTLLQEEEYLDNTAYPPDRHRTYEWEYGSDGYLVTAKYYDYRGNPSWVITYGYLGGKRVSKTGPFIHHSYDPPPMLALPGSVKPQQPKRDDRYTSAWEYKYDRDARLVEELRYNNSNVADFRETYEYDGNIKKSSGCGIPCNSAPFVKTVTLDEKGLELKVENSRDSLKEPEVTTFKYLSFDSQGNWTKREAIGTQLNSRGNVKPLHYIEYRTLTYF